MYFVVEQDQLRETEREEFLEQDDAVAVYTSTEWEQEEELKKLWHLKEPFVPARICKLESHAEYLYGTWKLPGREGREAGFLFYILDEKLIFIDDSGLAAKAIEGITIGKYRKEYDLERFLYDFLVSFILEDHIHLEEMEKQISKLEEDILNHQLQGTDRKLLELKKSLARYSGFYTQLTELGQELMDNQSDFFEKDDIRTFDRFRDRAGRLGNQTQILREYVMQVQDVYQSQIGIEQNNVMKVLTIVTTIMLPLTLIAGWYGMNFKYMPELSWAYGYPLVILISLVIVTLILWIFKKKKFW